MRVSWRPGVLILGSCAWLIAAAASPPETRPEPGLLFYLSGDRGLTADYSAGGTPEPNYASEVTVIPDGARGPGLQCGHTQLLSYWAPGNIHAQRGTLAFSWRSREPVGPTPFPIFRVGYADHSSWDMVWLRIDYNGASGFDAFVTDASLARTRVTHALGAFPPPSAWTHLAFSWDETRGVRFYVNGRLAAAREASGRFDAALDQLERAHREGQMQLLYVASDPAFRPLRGTPRYRRLLAALRAPPAGRAPGRAPGGPAGSP